MIVAVKLNEQRIFKDSSCKCALKYYRLALEKKSEDDAKRAPTEAKIKQLNDNLNILLVKSSQKELPDQLKIRLNKVNCQVEVISPSKGENQYKIKLVFTNQRDR